MSIFSPIASMIFPVSTRARGGYENPSNPLEPGEWWNGFGPNSDAGIQVNRKTALTSSAIWRGVQIKSGDVGKLPLCVFKQVGEGKERDKTNPIYRLLRRKPNREMTAFVFKRTLQAHVDLQGNGYAYITRKGNGEPTELLPLMPDHTFPVRENGVLLYVTEYAIDGVWKTRKIPAADMLHIKGLGYDGLTGYSFIEYGANSIGLGMAAQKYGSKFLANNARPSVVIEIPGNMSSEAQKTFLAQWDAMHQGIEQSHRTAILTNGAKVNPFSINARDSQLLETREFEIREIANWLGLPPHKLGDKSRSAYNTLEQENQSYLNDLDHSLVAWEEECFEKLLTERDKETEAKSIEFVRQALLRPNTTERVAIYSSGIANGWMSPNEVRALENMNPREGGDEYLTPLNMTTSSQAVVEDEPVEPEEEPEDEPTDDEDRSVADSIRRAIAHVSLYANRQAEQPKGFGKWLGEMRAKNLSAVADAVLPVSGKLNRTASDAVSRVLSEIHSALEIVWSNTTEERFSEAIAECVKKLETELPERLAAELTKGDKP